MSLVKKLKDILFEEEEEYTEPLKVREIPKEESKIVKIEPVIETKEEEKVEEIKEPIQTGEREIFRSEKSFQFPDFDEDEFVNSISKTKPKVNVLEYERKKSVEKRTDYGRYERVETREYTEKKKFKPSPIISPVYGVLNQDYRAEDIVNKSDSASNINIEEVRKKAFEPKKEEIKETIKETIDEPVVTFFEEKDSIKTKEESNSNYKSIDDLLEDASTEISLEDTLEIPKTNNIDAIEDELEKLDVEEKDKEEKEDTLDNDLFELIDSMYDEREED